MSIKTVIRGLGPLVLVILLLGAWALPATAATNGQWAVAPESPAGAQVRRANFHIEVQPGDTLSDALTISNATDQPIGFRLFAADAYNTPRGGGFALTGADDATKDVATWIKLPVEQFVSPPRSVTRIPFVIQVPRRVEPGEHVGGIVALNLAPTLSDAGDVKVAVKRAVGVRVYARVAGPIRPSLAVRRLSGAASLPVLAPAAGSGHATIKYSVENTGNVSLDVTARLRVSDLFGRTVKTFPARKVPGLLPHQHADLDQVWSDLPALGLRLQPHLELAAGQVRTDGSTSFLAVPWLLVAALIVVVGGWWWRRRRRRAGAVEPDPVAPSEQPTGEPIAVG